MAADNSDRSAGEPGTSVAIAAAILMIRELDAEAIVASFPCDHHYRHEAAFLDGMEAAIGVARDKFDSIVIIGAEATYPEMEYGWIEPMQALPNGRFAPRTSPSILGEAHPLTAQDLLRRGFLALKRFAFLPPFSFVQQCAMENYKTSLRHSDYMAECSE